jgi:hypothetical protein
MGRPDWFGMQVGQLRTVVLRAGFWGPHTWEAVDTAAEEGLSAPVGVQLQMR